MSDEQHRMWGVLTDAELAQRVAGMIDPDGALDDAEARAKSVIALVRANTTCLGNLDRGCY